MFSYGNFLAVLCFKTCFSVSLSLKNMDLTVVSCSFYVCSIVT